MTDLLPLPPKEVVSSIPQFQFLQDSLAKSGVTSFEVIVFTFPKGQLVNGWYQQGKDRVSAISLERATTVAKCCVDMLNSAMMLSQDAELLRVRFQSSELLVIPSSDELVIAAMTSSKSSHQS